MPPQLPKKTKSETTTATKTTTTAVKKADVYVLPHLVAWPRRPLKTKGSRNALKMSKTLQTGTFTSTSTSTLADWQRRRRRRRRLRQSLIKKWKLLMACNALHFRLDLRRALLCKMLAAKAKRKQSQSRKCLPNKWFAISPAQRAKSACLPRSAFATRCNFANWALIENQLKLNWNCVLFGLKTFGELLTLC